MTPQFNVIRSQGRLGPVYRVEFEMEGQTYRSHSWPTEAQALEQARMQLRSMERPPESTMLGSATRLSITPLDELRGMARKLGIRGIRGKRKWDLIKAMQQAWEEQNCG